MIRYGHPRYYDWYARYQAMSIEKSLERVEEDYKLLMDNQEPLFNEAYWIDEWAFLSPVTNFQNLAYILARTTLRDKLVLSDEGIAYRDAYIDYLRREKIIASWRWFTDDKPGQEGLVPDPEAIDEGMLRPDSDFMRQRTAWVVEQEKTRSPRSVDLAGVPPFTGGGTYTIGESLARMTPGLIVMLLTLGIALLLAITRFSRYDPA